MENGKKKLEGQRLWQQYDRVLLQIREEVKELYWLYSFFFAADSALLGIFFFKKSDLVIFLILSGIYISIIWIIALYLQRKWEHYWIEKLKYFEGEKNFNLEDKYRMWLEKGKVKIGSVWKTLYCLPIGFIIIWLISLALMFY